MSENTSCNYCDLQSIKARAKQKGKRVTVISNEVFVHPKSVNLTTRAPTRTERRKYFVAWFAEIPDRCCC